MFTREKGELYKDIISHISSVTYIWLVTVLYFFLKNIEEFVTEVFEK